MKKNKQYYFLFSTILIFCFDYNINAQIMNWMDVGIKKSIIGDITYIYQGIGRIDYITFDPNNADTIFACSPWGGVFITKDGGSNWESVGLEHKVEQPATSFIYIDPEDVSSSTWYVASGNADGPHRSSFQRESEGIYRTINRGLTWVNIGPLIKNSCNKTYNHSGNTLSCGYIINDIIKGPDSRQHLIISTSCGIWETKNALSTTPSWTKIIDGSFGSVVAQPDNENIIICAENLTTNPRIIMYDLNTYTELRDIDYSNQTGISVTSEAVNIALRFSKNSNFSDYLYLFFNNHLDNNNEYEGCIMWYKISTNEVFFRGNRYLGGFNRYDAVHVSNSDANIFYIANNLDKPVVSYNGLNENSDPLIFYSLGTNQVHVDQHYITQSPHNNKLWIANDGGVYVFEDDEFYVKVDGLAVSTIYEFDVAQLEDKVRYVAGYQDMGSSITDYYESMQTDESYNFRGGDGVGNFFDQTNFNIFTAGPGGRVRFQQDISTKQVTYLNNSVFTGDIYFDKTTPNLIFGIRNSELHKSANGGVSSEKWCPYDNIRSFAISPTDPNIIYCFSNSADILYKSSLGGGNNYSNWEVINFNFNFSASLMVVDYDNPHHLWLINAIWDPIQTQDLYSFNSKTLTLSTVSNKINSPIPNLLNTNIRSVVQEYNSNQGIYILTGDFENTNFRNIYYTDLTLDSWIELREGLPNTNTKGIKINQKSQEIYAATFGRGMWKSPLYCSALFGNFALPSSYINQSKHVTGTITANSVVGGLVTLRAGEEIVFNPGFETQTGADFLAIVRPCGSNKGIKSTKNSDIINKDLKDAEHNLLSIPDNNSDVIIYPNPSNGSFHITSTYQIPKRIDIYSLNGQIIETYMNLPTEKIEVDLSEYPSGIYIIRIILDGKIINEKIIIERR